MEQTTTLQKIGKLFRREEPTMEHSKREDEFTASALIQKNKLKAPSTENTSVKIKDAKNFLPFEDRMVKIYPEGQTPSIQSMLPYKFPEYVQLWKDSYKNNWEPEQLNMKEDIKHWNAPEGSDKYIDDNTRHMILSNLAFFGASEQLIGDNALSALNYYITSPEVRNLFLRLGFEESIHSFTFAHIIQKFNLDEQEVYKIHENVPAVENKELFMKEATNALISKKLDLETKADRRTFMEALLAQMIMEGVLFYGGFAMNLSLVEKGLMPDIGQQYAYIMRDETNHLKTMRMTFNHLKDNEWQDIWDEEFKEFTVNKFKEAVNLETEYAKYALSVDKGGVRGLALEDFIEYSKYLVNRRVEWIGLDELYEGAKNPFESWLTKHVDFQKQENQFESHSTNYKDELLIL